MQEHSTIPLGLCQCGCEQKTKIAKKTNRRTQAVKGQPLRFLQHHAPGIRTVADHFWTKVEKTDSCWIWTRSCSKDGYGIASVGHHTQKYAHRVAWELTYGPIPESRHVLHSCDVLYPLDSIQYRKCVNPDHLFLGTNLDNIKDRVAKGRSWQKVKGVVKHHPHRMTVLGYQAKGEAHYQAKLTEAIVREMRERKAATKITYEALANEFGISYTTAYHAVKGHHWKHVT